jgi:ABC-type spermidine/putrescine transport system permease subunit I
MKNFEFRMKNGTAISSFSIRNSSFSRRCMIERHSMEIAVLAVIYVIVAGVPIAMYIAHRRAWRRLLKSLHDSGIDIKKVMSDED